MGKNWKKEVARDTIAIGSVIFYIIVFVRAVIGNFPPFVYQLLIAGFFLFIFSQFFKSANQHMARGIILGTFVTLFYESIIFTVFALFIFVLMIVSLRYLKVKDKAITNGALQGIVSAGLGYYITLAAL